MHSFHLKITFAAEDISVERIFILMPFYPEKNGKETFIRYKFGDKSVYIGVEGDLPNHVSGLLKARRLCDSQYDKMFQEDHSKYKEEKDNIDRQLSKALAATNKSNWKPRTSHIR